MYEQHSNDPTWLGTPGLIPGDSPAPYDCGVCLEGSDTPHDDGLCIQCRRRMGILWDRCTKCGKNCATAMGAWGDVSSCCRAPFYRCDATVPELLLKAGDAMDEGDPDTAEVLIRLAVRERRANTRRATA